MQIFRIAVILFAYGFSIFTMFLSFVILLAGFQSEIPLGGAVFASLLLGLLAFSGLLVGLMIDRQTIRTYSGLLKLSFGASLVVISLWVNLLPNIPN